MNDKRTILIVDDHKTIQLVVSNMLSNDYNIVTRSNGLEALAYFRNGEFPDLVILDMVMPKLTGLDFLTNIRNSGMYKDIPVVILSGKSDTPEFEQCKKIGIDGFVKKPFSPEDLKEKIKKALKHKQNATN